MLNLIRLFKSFGRLADTVDETASILGQFNAGAKDVLNHEPLLVEQTEEPNGKNGGLATSLRHSIRHARKGA